MFCKNTMMLTYVSRTDCHVLFSVEECHHHPPVAMWLEAVDVRLLCKLATHPHPLVQQYLLTILHLLCQAELDEIRHKKNTTTSVKGKLNTFLSTHELSNWWELNRHFCVISKKRNKTKTRESVDNMNPCQFQNVTTENQFCLCRM